MFLLIESHSASLYVICVFHGFQREVEVVAVGFSSCLAFDSPTLVEFLSLLLPIVRACEASIL